MKKLIFILLLTAVSFPLLSQDNNEKKPEKNEMKPALVVIDIQNEFLV